MATTKFKVVLASAAVLVATTALLVQQRSLGAMRAENEALRSQVMERHASEAATSPGTVEKEPERWRQERAELMRLRGEVAGLRRETAKVGPLEMELAKLRGAKAEEASPGSNRLVIPNPYLGRETWADKGSGTPYDTFETMLWAGITGNTRRLAEVTLPGERPALLKDRPPVVKIKGVQIVTVDGDGNGKTRVGAIVENEMLGAGPGMPPVTVQEIRFWHLLQTNGAWKVTERPGRW
jgi:hypothetical protein